MKKSRDVKMITMILSMLLFFSCIQMTNSLSRPNSVYKSIIKDVYEYYHVDYSTLFYLDSQKASDIHAMTKLKNLQHAFNQQFISTHIVMNIQDYVARGGIFPNDGGAVLNVLLDSSDTMKRDLGKLATAINISKFKWLIFFDDETDMNVFFENIDIPFNCEFLISMKNKSDKSSETIKEVYRISGYLPLRYNSFGTWHSSAGANFPDTSLYERRDSLYGHNLRIAIMHDPPNSFVNHDENNNTIQGGIYGELINVLKEDLNFTISYDIVKSYGILINNSWNGGIRNLIDNISDIFGSDIMMTSNRAKYIDFAMPLYLQDAHIFFQRSTSVLRLNKYLQPFEGKIWILLIFIIFFASAIIIGIKLYHKNKSAHDFYFNNEVYIVENILAVYGAFCGQGMKISYISSVKIMQLTLHLASVIIIAAYSAMVISTLAVNDLELPFRSLSEFVNAGKFSLGLLRNSARYVLFRDSKDAIMNEIFKFSSLVPSEKVGFEKVCSNSNFAYLASKIKKRLLTPPGCIIDQTYAIFRQSTSISFQKNSPFRDIFDQKLRMMKNGGVVKKMLDYWLTYRSSKRDESWSAVEFIDVAPLCILLIVTITLGCIILWWEKAIFKIMMKRKIASIAKRLITNIKYPSNHID